MTRHIISISQLYSDNNLLIELSFDSFVIKDRLTGAHFLKGPTKHGIYEWPSFTSILTPSSTEVSVINWHHRLEHPSYSTFKTLISTFKLNVYQSLFQLQCMPS